MNMSAVGLTDRSKQLLKSEGIRKIQSLPNCLMFLSVIESCGLLNFNGFVFGVVFSNIIIVLFNNLEYPHMYMKTAWIKSRFLLVPMMLTKH